ncbi:putative two-component system response regulator [Alicyclobacillus hesperidum]|uniref:Putative two-component system response regulator n=1 Tax=Alicyclobacillus hesperidum TaxID=89784 RepID=A0A1H2XNV6_9BACL|nr:HD domain-containing phosphohydrolase [Alicyclobacillus hesperidum]SDW94500.1 putative two-component system response regulator [Alicyclobacillus hesperidum]
MHANLMTPIFESIAYVAEYGEPDADRHVKRVATYARFIGQHVLGFAPELCERLALAALVHDVGKVAIPRELLRKPGPLTPAERQYVQQHTIHGRDMLADLARRYAGRDGGLFELAQQVSLYHHERWDGRGYPEGLCREEIPIAARVVHLVDVIDARLSPRPYKPGQSWHQVKQALVEGMYLDFDGMLVTGLLQVEPAFLELVQAQSYGQLVPV